jgi:hypothetical protein
MGKTWKPSLDLHGRVHRGAYRALPSRRKFVQKGVSSFRKRMGEKGCLGLLRWKTKSSNVPWVGVLNAIYEQDFLGFSDGFRPGRGQHDALDALAVGITHTKVSWIVDADVRSFFDSMSHEWLIRFVEHRIGDPRMIRLIRKWLKAGVMDGAEWTSSDIGSPQGQWCHRRSLTSTCITPSSCGLISGDATTPAEMSCSCATPTIPSLALV